MTEIDDDQFLAGVDFVFELLRCDAANAKLVQEFAASQPLSDYVGSESGHEKNGKTAAQAGGVFGDNLDLFAEDVARAEERESPDQSTESVKEKKLASAHVEDAGKGRRHGAEAGDEFGDEQ